MKITVKSCQDCERMFMVSKNIINGKFCRICRTKIQRQSESKLSDYLHRKYNNKIIGVNEWWYTY